MIQIPNCVYEREREGEKREREREGMKMMMTAAVMAVLILVAATADDTTPFRTDSQDSLTSIEEDYRNNVPSSSSSSGKAAAIFMIGDSTVDCGENTLFYPLLRHNLSLLPCSNASDSTLVPHFLARKMGLQEIPTFYEQNGTLEGILNGLNYGSAQATILTDSDGPSFQSLNQQLRQAFETIQLLQLQLGQPKADHFINSSLFYLSVGKDDYINYFFPNSSLAFNGGEQAFSRLLVDEMTHAVRDLYDAGVRKVVYMGVLPVGCSPRAVVNWYFTRGRDPRLKGCVDEINELISSHNQQLNARIIELNLEFPDAKFVFCDAFKGIMEIISNHTKYGIEATRGACCGAGWHGAGMGCQSMKMACSQPSNHLWWDFYNPTEAVNSLLADSAWSGQPLADICHPLTVQTLVDA